MKLASWYKKSLLFWLFTGLPLHSFVVAFNGLPFFTLIDPPPQFSDDVGILGWLIGFTTWLGGAALIYHPFLTWPFAVRKGP